MNLPTLEDLESQLGDLKDTRALVRADFNVPIENGEIADDLRITAALPTLEWLQGKGCELTICSHLGRPETPGDPDFSLDPVRVKLKELGVEANVLPNTRFNKGESSNDPSFVAELIADQDCFVNDAFGVTHRSHASTIGPIEHLPSAAGRLISKELAVLDEMIENPGANFVAVLGGLKISDKLPVVESLLEKCDSLCIAGAMAFTFLKAQGLNVGDSLVEDSMLDKCAALMDSGVPIHLPMDFVGLSSEGAIGQIDDAPIEHFDQIIPEGWLGADIGPESCALFSEVVGEASTIFWNGPVGAFEDPRFAAGTSVMADALADVDGMTIVGGGDSASAVRQFGAAEEIDHISTGGGACLSYIQDGDLPVLEALRNQKG